ncbi:hypothetical protein BGZ50_003201 [Haplosporangium sp. Z 11]|nr:hypothetical protein BGZ50_003201 [Haplosporangium sp. Z 11]
MLSNSTTNAPPKVTIIGAGIAGSAVAFVYLMNSGAPGSLVYDIDTSVARGQILDLEDANKNHSRNTSVPITTSASTIVTSARGKDII